MFDLDLASMLNYHRSKKSKITIALTPVEDPTAYGLVKIDKSGRIIGFLEKPTWEKLVDREILMLEFI